MKTKEYNMNSNLIPLFTGTYESRWEVYETDEDGNEIEVDYTGNDLMKSIVDAYESQTPQILRDLKYDVDFITDIKFTKTFSSPREYNFSTDVIDFDVTIDVSKLNKTLDKLETDVKFHKFLKDNYSSRDGFMSFTPDNFNDIKSEIINDGNEAEQSIGAIIQYLCNDTLNEIENDVIEYWSGNGYEGLNYTIE